MMIRLYINKFMIFLSSLAAAVGLMLLAWILSTLIFKGVTSITPYIFTHDLIDNGIRNLLWGAIYSLGACCYRWYPIRDYGGYLLARIRRSKPLQ